MNTAGRCGLWVLITACINFRAGIEFPFKPLQKRDNIYSGDIKVYLVSKFVSRETKLHGEKNVKV